MKIQKLITGALALSFAASAMADVEIVITGATAFRQAAMKAIYNAYDSVGDVGVDFNIAHDFSGNTTNQLSQLIASNKAVFVGEFPNVSGVTTIRTSFNGSAEGLDAIAGNSNPALLAVSTATAPDTGTANDNTPNDGIRVAATTLEPTSIRPKFSFSDVYQSSTPVDTDVDSNPITLEPVGLSAVGVVTFAMVTNEGAPANFTNVSIQQARALWGAGALPLSVFTGNSTDTKLVLATGRNDGSGTRASCLSEWGYGVANTVKQFVHTNGGSSGNTITSVTLVPADGVGVAPYNTASNNASSLWGNTAVGNGGYSSGSTLRSLMGRASTSVTAYNGASATPLFSNQSVLFLTWLSTADSQQVAAALGKVLSFNGVGVTPLAATDPNNFNGSGFNEADYNKIVTGNYSAWNYQHLYHYGTLSADEQAWRDELITNWIDGGIQQTSNGVTLTDMAAERADDGFAIFPL